MAFLTKINVVLSVKIVAANRSGDQGTRKIDMIWLLWFGDKSTF